MKSGFLDEVINDCLRTAILEKTYILNGYILQSEVKKKEPDF